MVAKCALWMQADSVRIADVVWIGQLRITGFMGEGLSWQPLDDQMTGVAGGHAPSDRRVVARDPNDP